MRVRIDQIIPDPNQPRKTFDEEAIKKIASSFESYGVITPLKVRSCGDNQYMIITGELRYRAAKQRGDREIECVIQEATDQQAREMQFIENYHRQDILPWEQWEAWDKHIKETGIKQSELSQRTGIPLGTVKIGLNTLYNLDINVQQSLKNGDVQVREAVEIARIPDGKRQQEAAQPFIKGEFKTTDAPLIIQAIRKEPGRPVKDIINDIQSGKAKEQEMARLEAAKRASGIAIETPEELMRGAEALRKEAERKAKETMTPEEKAEEERKKLVAEARRSLDSTAKKIDRASGVMDVSQFRERLTRLEEALESNPSETKAQLTALGEEVTEAEKQAKAEAKRLKDEKQKHKKAEEDQKREGRAEKKARKQLLEDPTFLGEVLDKAPKELIEEKLFTEEEREIISKPSKPTTIMDQFYELERQSKKLSDGLAELTEFPPMGKALLGIALQTLRARIDETLERMGLEVIEGEAKLIEGD